MLTLAHGIVGRADLPIPAAWFGVAAAVVLVVSFLALAAAWTRPRLEDAPERVTPLRVPLLADVVLGAVGVATFLLAVYAGLAGTTDPRSNFAGVTITVTFWVGVPVASLLLGDVWRLLSPWRAVGRLAGWLVARGGQATEPLPYPARLGRWPAVAVLFGWALVELCWGAGTEPRSLAVLALVVLVVNLAGQGLYGVAAWGRNGDAFGVYFGLFAAMSPWRRHADGRLVARPPLGGLPPLPRPAATVALLCVAIGSTTFDGAKEGPLFSSVVPEVQDAFEALGLSVGAALEWTFVLGLVACVALVAGLYRLGVLGIGGAAPPRERALDYVHTLVPIAVAYVVAHYFSYLAYNVQLMWPLLSDPLGDGSDLLGGAGAGIDYSVVSATAIWYVQVVTLVLGHVAAIVLAHDRGLARAGAVGDATRSQVVMLAVMVAFTSLGLWLLSVSNA